MKVVKIKHKWDNTVHCYYYCPGCKYDHAFNPSVHQWNEDREKPTVTPSLLNSNPQNYHTCHSYIKDGQIQFLSDCWHDLKGQTVSLVDIDVSHFDLEHVEII